MLFASCAGGPDARIRSIYALGRSPSEPHKNRIEAMSGDPDRDVRVAVLVVMETVDPARAERLARSRIDDPDGLVRGAAVKILGPEAAADPELTRLLVAKASGDPDGQVRQLALEAVATLDDPAIGPAFSAALSDARRLVRRTALIAGAARPGLLPLDRVAALAADDPDWENRVEAARALGASKDPAAYAGLEQALHDGNEFVRAAAARGRRNLERAGIPMTPPATAEPKTGSGV